MNGITFLYQRLFLLLTFQFLLFTCSSQDLHFSQFFNSPLSTNPANAGFIPDADHRYGVQYRNQYSNIMSIPYKTFSVFGDAQLLRNKIENGWMGIGGLLMNDVAGSGSLQSTKLYASLAYHQMIGNSSLLSAGFNAGWVSKSINTSKLKFPDQFDGRFFDSNLPTSVALDNTSVNYLDLQSGINYAFFPNDEVYLNAGYSIHHVNRAKESFFSQSVDSRIPWRHIGFINAMVKLNDDWIIQPNVYYTNQANAYSLLAGSLINYNLSEHGEQQLLFGGYYRWKDAFIPMAGFEISGLQFLFSYDATTSSLRQFNQYRGAYEFSLMKKSFYPTSSGRESICPRF